MTTHVYAFGSVCRGEIDPHSDVDLLALVDAFDVRFDPGKYSIYSHSKMQKLWEQGNPFAWHLSLESRLLHASDSIDYIHSIGAPREYRNTLADCLKFREVFNDGKRSLRTDDASRIFDMSSIFLSVRNFATCYSLGVLHQPVFSRNAARCLGQDSLPLHVETYQVLERARVLCTRSVGPMITFEEAHAVFMELDVVQLWMDDLLQKVMNLERV